MNKKYIISGMLGTLLLGFTTVFALNIVTPTTTNPIFKAVYIWWSSAGTATCVETNSPICLDSGGVYLNLSPVDNSNILKWNSIEKKFSVGPLNGDDIPDNIITATHILDWSVLTRKLNRDPGNITIPTYGWMIKSNNTCWTNETAVGISWWNMVCEQVDFLNSQEWLPNCWSSGGWYTLVGSGIEYVSGWVTVYGYKWECKSNVINVLWADGGDMNWSGSSTWNIWNKNIGNVWVGLTNPAQTLTVQDSLNINGMGEKILCMRTDEYVDIETYNEDDCAKCDAGYTYNSTTKVCEKGCAMCAGTWSFPNATLCTGDDAYVPAGSSYSLDLACDQPEGGKKCQYTCNPWFILINWTCKECMAGTFNTWSNACIIKPICDENKEATLSWGVAVCAALGNCYQGIFGWWGLQFWNIAPLWPEVYVIGYYDSDRSYKYKTDLSLIYIENPSRPIWENRIWTYVPKEDLKPNKCLFTCAEWAFRINGKCFKASCQDGYFEDGTYVWYPRWQTSYLSGATNATNYYWNNSWIDVSVNTSWDTFIAWIWSQTWCFYACPYGYDIDAKWRHICKDNRPVVVDEGVQTPPPPMCKTTYDPNNLKTYRSYFQVYSTGKSQEYLYTGRDEFNILTGNKVEGCFYSCKPPAIKPSNYNICIPKCTSEKYIDDDYYYCLSCHQYWTATGPLDPNGNNTTCIYDCPDNLYFDSWDWYCAPCPVGKIPWWPLNSNGSYTRCVDKCDIKTEGYSPTGDYCYSLNSTPTVCPSWFFKEETSPGVFQCLYCLAGTTWDDTEKKCK